MKKNAILGVCAAMMLMLGGCSSDESGKEFHVRNCANTGCKKTFMTRGVSTTDADFSDISENEEYIEYKALGGGYLSLNHFNTIFNCAVSQLNVQAVIEDHVIKVLEKANEPEYLADCVCPFDLYCEVGPLTEGDYKIFIYKGSYDGADYTHFSITYKTGLNGIYTPQW